eukprot:scaffold1223_cov119-Cylindrotheca_fusiformis.AAC.7
MRRSRAPSAVLLVALLSATTSGNDADSCPLWLAPSYTGTEREPKYSLFAGKSFAPNETFSDFAEIAIPLVDFDQIASNRNTPQKDQIVDFLEGFLWTSHFVGGQWEGRLSAPMAIAGIGVLPGYHTGIANVNFLQAASLLSDTEEYLVAGQSHLSRGAISPYHNVTLKATRQIPQGMELFADFGDLWDGNFTDDIYQDTIRRYDYEIADGIIQSLLDFYDEFPNLSEGMQQEIIDFMLDKVLGTAAGKHAKTIRSLIPASAQKLKRVKDEGGSFMYRYADMIRSTKWLQNNGFCLGAMKAGPSTIEGAGRGAFATRGLRQGETITITPMLHIADKELLTMYPIHSVVDPTTGEMTIDYDRSGGPSGTQLIINYCFGHPDSSLLLFPLGSLVNLINHSRKGSNAYMTWSKRADKLPNQHQYHDFTVEQMANTNKIVLTMKVVATRDIGPGEEIFLDYGPQWEHAWQEYQQKWELERKGVPHPLKAKDMRDRYKAIPFEIPQTMRRNPYPPNIATACFMSIRERPDGKTMFDKTLGVDITEWASPAAYEDYQGSNLFIVDILERKNVDHFFYNYTVIAKISETRIEEIADVPHAACTFVDVPYKSDIHLDGAFRHSIGIIDSHFPQKWRDLRDAS